MEDLSEVLAKENYEGLVENSIRQLEINFDGKQPEQGKPVTIQVQLPYNLLQAKESGKEIVVIHFHGDGAGELIETKDIGDKEGFIQFEVDKFSLFALAAVDAKKEADMVKVTLKKVDNGIGLVYAEFGQRHTGYWERRYLPLEEEVKVPAGTGLHLRACGVKEGYQLSQDNPYKIFVDGEEDLTEEYFYQIPDVAKSVVFEPVFEKEDYDVGDDSGYYVEVENAHQEDWDGEKVFSGILKLYKRGSDVALPATDWQINAGAGGLLEVTDPQRGTLVSKVPLKAGVYSFDAFCKLDGEWLEGDYGAVALFLGVIDVEFGIDHGQYSGDYTHSGLIGRSDWTDSGTSFDEILEDSYTIEYIPGIISMYGGYKFMGWYEKGKVGVESGRLDGKGYAVTEDITAFAGFYRESDKKWYNGSSSSENTTNQNRPSGGRGSGGGGGSAAKANTDTMTGSWQRDDRGWRFLQTGGSYAADAWGWINGNWYYFGADTYAMTGWIYVSDQWYYLNPEPGDNEGKMVIGWIFDPSYQKWFYTNMSGAMLTGWQQIGNAWYYLNPIPDGTRGAMAAEQWIDGYYVGTDGAWVQSLTQ